jgi:hypothetical protein
MTPRVFSWHDGYVPQESRDSAHGSATLQALYTTDGAFPVHVVHENGLPNVALTVFANDLRRILSDSSVRGYAIVDEAMIREAAVKMNRGAKVRRTAAQRTAQSDRPEANR